MKIPTRMHIGYLHSGGCDSLTRMPSGLHLDICILGVAIRENPDTYAFWGLRFGYLHSGGY